MKYTLPKSLRIAFGVTLVLLFANALVAFWSGRGVLHATREVEATHQVISEVEEIVSVTKDAQLWQQEYLLTDAPESLARYRDAASAIDRSVERLRRATAHDRGMAQQIATLQQELRERLDELDSTVVMRQSAAGLPAAIEEIRTGRGQREMEDLRRLAGEIETRQQTILSQQSDRLKSHRLRSDLTFAAATLLSLAFMAMLYELFTRHLRERQQAEEATRMQARVLERMREGVCLLNDTGTILFTNRAEDEIFGNQPGESVGASLTSRLRNESGREKMQAVIDHVLPADGNWTGELECCRKDGSDLITFARISSMDLQDRRYWVCVQDDITEQKRLQQDRERAYAREQAARARAEESSELHRQGEEWMTLLVEASSALIASLELDELLPRILGIAQRMIAADGYAVWRRFPDGSWRTVASFGVSDVFLTELLPDPGQAAANLQEPVLAEDPEGMAVLRGRLPAYRAEGIKSLLIMPLRIHGVPSGTLVFYYRQPHQFPEREVRVGAALANLVASAVGTNDNILERRRSEEVNRFLADASETLGAIAAYENVLEKIATLAVPFFADWCAVDVLESDGGHKRLAVTHTDPAKVDLIRDLTPATSPDAGIAKVMETGEPDWCEEITDELLRKVSNNSGDLQKLRQLKLKSYICVPLKSRGVVEGTILFATSESNRRYTSSDLRIAEDLARRTMTAVENSRLYDALRESDRRKDQFLATLAHELRNPLAPLSNALQIWPMVEDDHAELEQLRKLMERQVRQMTRLIDDLLDVSRITRGRIELRKEPMDLATVVQAALESVQPFVQSCNHRLEVNLPDEPVMVSGDPARLVQVFGNLIHNAAKYTGRNGQIWIEARQEKDDAIVKIRDNGPGIPTEMLTEIFGLFTQVDQTLDRSHGGLGIGLTLVQSLVSLHGGSVQAFSDGPGSGCEFVVRLPAEQPQTDSESENLPRSDSLTINLPQHRVLVVDDVEPSAKTLALMLRSLGQETRTEYDGPSALQAVATFKPDVVFLDIAMPGMDGYEVARQLRQDPVADATVLVALTGFGQDEDRRRAFDAGFHFHLVKPTNLDALQQVLREVKQDSTGATH